MSLLLFRSCSLSSGLLKRCVTSSAKLAVGHFKKADDVTKFTTGILQTQSNNYYSHRRPCQPQQYSTLDCHGHYCNRILSNVDINSWGVSPQSHQLLLVCSRKYSTDSKTPADKPKGGEQQTTKSDGTEVANEEPEKLSIYQRFKRTYKEHGKILVAVHLVTSTVWYSSFYMAARSGIDIVPYLEQWGFSEKIINPFRAGGLGDFALAYLMYKLATPARYTVTIGGTNMVIRMLRSRGKMAPKSEEDSFRELVKFGRKHLDTKLRRERRKKIKALREAQKSQREGK